MRSPGDPSPFYFLSNYFSNHRLLWRPGGRVPTVPHLRQRWQRWFDKVRFFFPPLFFWKATNNNSENLIYSLLIIHKFTFTFKQLIWKYTQNLHPGTVSSVPMAQCSTKPTSSATGGSTSTAQRLVFLKCSRVGHKIWVESPSQVRHISKWPQEPLQSIFKTTTTKSWASTLP